MNTTFINYHGNRYNVEGCKRAGFAVYVLRHKSYILMGRSICDTPRKAVIDVTRNSYCAHY